jgi:hypothetical protein
MKKILILIFLIFISTKVFSQENSYSPFNINNEDLYSSSLKESVNKDVDGVIYLNLDRNILNQLLSDKRDNIVLNIPINSDNLNSTAKIYLERFDVLNADAEINITTANGNEKYKLTEIPLSYKGNISNDKNTLAALTISKNGIEGILTSGNDTYILGKLDNMESDFVLYQESKMKIKSDFLCGFNDLEYMEEIEKLSREFEHKESNGFNEMLDANIAIDLDFATYNIYNQSVQNTINYALTLMTSASALYCKDMNIRLMIPYINVWTVQDPYVGATSSPILSAFRSYWNANNQSVQRTVAHLISRRAGNLGGIAYLNVLCSNPVNGSGYGFSNTNGPISPLPVFSWDVMVVCHELGHNFGSPHTHCWPGSPIDSCYASEAGCYNGPPIPRLGTIMSYCHLNGSIKLDFGPLPSERIRITAEGVPCINNSPQALFLAYPNGGERFNTASTAKIYWGTSITGNINIEYSSNNGQSWNVVGNNINAQLREYDWVIPYIGSTTEAKVRIYNPSNPSQADTSDAGFTINLVLNSLSLISPPTNFRLEVNPVDTTKQHFHFTAAGTIPSIRYKVKFKKLGAGTVDNLFESNNNGQDTSLSISYSMLDSLANLMGTTGDSVRCTWIAWAYSGTDSISSGGHLLNLVRTTVSINQISSTIPDKFNLYDNYPNPFNPSTKIKFDIAKFGNVNLTVFDMLGRKVEVLVNEQVQPGKYEVDFNAINLSSGIYYYRMETSEYVQTKKMLMIK